MQKLILALGCVVALSSFAFAETHKLPEEKPIASITIPDAWETDDIDNGIEATSDDGEIYLSVEKTDSGKVSDALDEAMKYLKEKGVTITESSMKQQEAKLNGMNAVDFSWDGKDEEGPAKISLMVVSVSDKEGLLLIYWASPEGEKKHQEELSAIAKSINKV